MLCPFYIGAGAHRARSPHVRQEEQSSERAVANRTEEEEEGKLLPARFEVIRRRFSTEERPKVCVAPTGNFCFAPELIGPFWCGCMTHLPHAMLVT